MATKVQQQNCSPNILYYCPGCEDLHCIPVSGKNAWQFNGDFENPTVSPSVKHSCDVGDPPETRICHYFIRDGNIEYCGDCWHDLKNQKVEMWDIVKYLEHDADREDESSD